MHSFVFKLLVSPFLIQAARRWGQAVGGWLVGLPLTSGPIAFFLALDQGKGFAADAAAGSLAGTAAHAARRRNRAGDYLTNSIFACDRVAQRLRLPFIRPPL